MSYTTQVRSICEVKAGRSERAGFDDVENILRESWDKIFTSDWNTFDPEYKSVLCCKILRHYYTRQICAETVGLWRLWLNAKMCEIMPYYNQLYKSSAMEFDPLLDTDITTTKNGGSNTGEEGERHSDNSSTRTDDLTSTRTDNLHQHTSDTAYNLYNDTPQGGLSDIEDMSYLTDARKNYGDTDTDNTGTQATKNTGTQGVVGDTDETDKRTVIRTEQYIESIKGKRGGATYSKMLEEYRKTLLNIDAMIIKDLKDLFFNIY